MKAYVILLCLLSCLYNNHTVSLDITRRVNSWYRDTKDIDGYAEIARSGWNDVVINEVMLRSA